MKIKASSLIDQDIYTINEGKKIASVRDIIYDPTSQKVLALLLDYGSVLTDPHVLLISDIRSFGKDAVMIDSAQNMRSTADVDEIISRIAKDDIYLTKTRIVTNEGRVLGNISDIYFDPLTGKVEEFEVSQRLKDLSSGKKIVKTNDILTIGQDATIVKGYVAERIEEQAKEKELEKSLYDRPENFFNQLKNMLYQTAKRAKLEFNYYKNETPNLESPQTNYPVKSPFVNYFSSRIKENQAENSKAELEDFFKEGRKAFTHYSHDIKKENKKIRNNPILKKQFEKFNNPIAQLKDEGKVNHKKIVSEIDEKRKQNVIGRFLTKNILSKDDQILGKRGDIITNKLLLQADKEGIVDQILNNNTIEPLHSDF